MAKDESPATGWHMSSTYAGKKPGQGTIHYDIGSDDGENIALVYPAEDGLIATARRARRIVAVNALYDALLRLSDADSDWPWWWHRERGRDYCKACEYMLAVPMSPKDHAEDCPVRQALEAIDLADKGDGK